MTHTETTILILSLVAPQPCPTCKGSGWMSSLDLVGIPGADPMYGGCEDCKDGTVEQAQAGPVREALSDPCKGNSSFHGNHGCLPSKDFTTGRVPIKVDLDSPRSVAEACGRLLLLNVIPVEQRNEHYGAMMVAVVLRDLEAALTALAAMLQAMKGESDG